ncbi:hypothetical protein QJS10_CPB14g00360 [Acorus calamus]|uniref:AB hydrolase-1 domain-containing protein n=1 Tax=Acorus calamus TaxID=4465 RepID=A0AAV9DBW4_ACOCL|nr:hypothetical protein QJS10_CPB14g00360 [Acorus calamus]
MTKTPLAVLGKPPLPPRLKEGQTRHFHRLPSGLAMEAIVQKSSNSDSSLKPPLVFVHGSFHAAWCWAEHWLPFFSGEGFDCHAISLLGQGESDVPAGANVAGSLETHASDVADYVQKEVRSPPVLFGHSFGGLIVQSYISSMSGQQMFRPSPSSGSMFTHPTLSGAVLICSVPPSGNSGLVWRYLMTKPIAALKVTLSLAAKAFANSLPLCKETFFSATMDDDLVQRYQELMKNSSRIPLFDLRKLNASLPVASIPRDSIEILVMGASDDFIVDAAGLRETAEFYGVQPVCVDGVAHDMMLDCSWEKGALVILQWLKALNKEHLP